MKVKQSENLFHVKDNEWVAVVDEEIKEGDYYLLYKKVYICTKVSVIYDEDLKKYVTIIHTIGRGDRYSNHHKKIIGTINFKLEGIPYCDLPDEDELTEQHWNEYKNKLTNSFSSDWEEHRVRTAFQNGYNKAREKYKYTEEDLRDAIRLAQVIDYDEDGDHYFYHGKGDEILNIITQSKLIQEIEFEIDTKLTTKIEELADYTNFDDGTRLNLNVGKLKTIPDPNHEGGKLVIKNIKYE